MTPSIHRRGTLPRMRKTPDPPDGWILFPKQFDISPLEFDEWLSLFRACLSRRIVLSGGSLQTVDLGETGMWQEWTPRSENASMSILIKRQESGLLVSLSGEYQSTDEEIEAWLSCIEQARSEIGEKHTSFEWTAILGPIPGGWESGDKALKSEVQLGDFFLGPGNVRHVEWTPSQQPMLGQASIYWSWPIVAKGSSRGYNEQSALKRAVQELVELCAYLSLVWDQAWCIRTAPIVNSEPTIQESAGWARLPENIEFGDSPQAQLEFPAWGHNAWERALNDEVLKAALLAHYQGLTLEWQHPSFASVALVAAIETVGSLEIPLARCECCPECRITTGSTRRYRAGLKRAVSGEAYNRLVKAYEPRSRTAHSGALHGAERTGGWIPLFGELYVDPGAVFSWHLLELRKTSRDLLIQVLTNEPQVGPST